MFATSILLLTITRHRNMLEKDRNHDLAEKELQYRTLVEQIPGITYVLSIDTSNPIDFKILYISPRFESWLGYSISDFYQDSSLWVKIIPQEDRERVLRTIGRHAMAEKLSIDEYRIIARDNQIIWVRNMFRTRPGTTSNEKIAQGILLNITEQKYIYEKSRRESDRTAALLRIAGRLNMQLDLDALLFAISEEVGKALNVPISMVGLYDKTQDHIYTAGSMGLGEDAVKSISPVSKRTFDEIFIRRGPAFATRNIYTNQRIPNVEEYRKLNFKSMATAVMEHEQKIIGTLTVMTISELRDFNDDELLLLRGIADQSALAIVNTSNRPCHFIQS